MKEIRLSELAKENSTMDDCKKMADMMIQDHTKAQTDLQALAAKKAVTLPTALSDDSQKDYSGLNEKKGMDFDKKYCDMMVDGHKDAISKYEKFSTDAADPDIRAMAASMLPKLRTHLDHAMTCQQNCKKM
jgi:putative membrane protein